MKTNRLCLTLLSLILLASCGRNDSSIVSSTSSSDTTSSVESTSVESTSSSSKIDAASLTLSVPAGTKESNNQYVVYTNSTIQLTATVSPENAIDKSVDYTIQEGKEDIASVSAEGVVTFKDKIGTVTVNAMIRNTQIKSDITFKVINNGADVLASLNSAFSKNLTLEASKLTKAIFKDKSDSENIVTYTSELFTDMVKETKVSTPENKSSDYTKIRTLDKEQNVYYEIKTIDGKEDITRITDATDERYAFQASHFFFNNQYGFENLITSKDTGLLFAEDDFASKEALENMKASVDETTNTTTLTSSYNIQAGESSLEAYCTTTAKITTSSGFITMIDYQKDLFDTSVLVDGKLPENATSSQTTKYEMSFVFDTKVAGDSTLNPSGWYYTDYTPAFSTQFGDETTGYKIYKSTSKLKFTVPTFAPSTANAAIDPITIKSVENEGEYDYNVAMKVSDTEVRFNNIGKTKITFSSSTGLEKVLVLDVLYHPVTAVNLTSSNKDLVQGRSDTFSANVLPVGETQEGTTAKITKGESLATLVNNSDGSYTVTAKEDATVGEEVVVSVTSNGVNASGEKVTSTITYTIKQAAQTGEDITDELTSDYWYDEDYSSNITFNKNGTGELTMSDGFTEYHFSFHYNATTGQIILSDIVADNDGDEIVSMVYDNGVITVTISSEDLEDGTLTMVFEI